MGSRGPQKTPLSILQARGSRLAGQRSEPHFTGEIPEPPDWLLPAARDEWERLLPVLIESRVMTPADWTTFAGYCQSFGQWAVAEAFMVEHGTTMTLRDDKGQVRWVQPVPQFGIAQKCLGQMLRFGRELGLSPSSRTNVSTSSPPTTSPKSRFFSEAAS